MSFPFFLVGPMLKIIAGVVQYAIDSSKDAAPEPSSISGQAPTVEFSPLLAELLGAQAYANAVPTGWLTPEGGPNASATSAAPSAGAVAAPSASIAAVSLAGAQPAFANASLRPVFVQGEQKPIVPVPGLTSESTGGPLPSQPSTQTPVGGEAVSGVAGQAVQQPEGNGLEKLSVGDALQVNAAGLTSSPPSVESTKEQSGTPKVSGPAPITIDASSQEQPVSGTSTGQGEQGLPFGGSGRSPRAGLALDPLPAGQIQSAPDRNEPLNQLDLTGTPPLPAHPHRILGVEQAHEAAPASLRELPNITDQLVHAVRINVESGRTEARLHLEPPDLGAVRIQMVMDQQSLSLRFHAGNDATRALLEASLGELRDNLSQQGISVGQMSVGLTLDLANQNGGQLPAPWMIRNERWPSAASTRDPEPQLVPAAQISLSALDLFA